jgi:hypothetical protein
MGYPYRHEIVWIILYHFGVIPMSEQPNLFELMFRHAERISLEEFTDEDLEKEGIIVPPIPSYEEDEVLDKIAAGLNVSQEGLIKAVAGDFVRDYTDAYREIKGYFLNIESKRKYINELCQDTIEWLKEEDRAHPHLNLDMNAFFTWMKTSETYYWRYYYVLNDQVYNEIMRQIKNTEITELEDIVDFNYKERKKVARMLDSAKTIKDLIIIVERYRARCNNIFHGLTNRKRRIQFFPFQYLLSGYSDLNRTVKKIVNLAT